MDICRITEIGHIFVRTADSVECANLCVWILLSMFEKEQFKTWKIYIFDALCIIQQYELRKHLFTLPVSGVLQQHQFFV